MRREFRLELKEEQEVGDDSKNYLEIAAVAVDSDLDYKIENDSSDTLDSFD